MFKMSMDLSLFIGFPSLFYQFLLISASCKVYNYDVKIQEIFFHYLFCIPSLSFILK